ncbi:hypothetical protein BDN70DRAFT_561813 [Pholiota conissans]|uniref:Uncharacterized protein n=1 Tax=Pholiota conissans TaxID=109636 RepID=A0A9P6CV15_9AGAR|nr:hypothetical protein BDN70DRAFT_561813 [Pholiota conissans]
MPLLSLPFDILDAICRVVVQDATKATFCRCTDTEPPGFQQLFKTRRPKEATPYSARLVCKDFNDVLTKYLFRDVYIRLGWDWLHINPPLRELASNPNSVFRQNARALRIGPLIKDAKARYFQRDDTDRDDESLLYLPLDIYDVYPDPKSVAQKQEKLREVILEVQTYLANAIASLTNVEEFAWELHEAEYPDWFHDAVTAGLSSLKKMQHVRMCRRNNWRTRDKAPVPFFRDMAKFAKNTMHHLTHIDVNFNERLPPDYDQFWDSLKEARIKLISLRTNAVSMAALEYVASYSGIEILSYGHRTLAAPESINEDMAAYMFGTVLEQHLETLEVLELPVFLQDGESWSISEENIEPISKCCSHEGLDATFLP